jgi:hypothetical protein
VFVRQGPSGKHGKPWSGDCRVTTECSGKDRWPIETTRPQASRSLHHHRQTEVARLEETGLDPTETHLGFFPARHRGARRPGKPYHRLEPLPLRRGGRGDLAVRTFVNKSSFARPYSKWGRVSVDDAVGAVVEYDNGAIGMLEMSRLAVGRLSHLQIEINGGEGSVWWDLEKLNNLHVCCRGGERTPGFRTVSVTDTVHPYARWWWPRGHFVRPQAPIASLTPSRAVGPWRGTGPCSRTPIGPPPLWTLFLSLQRWEGE